MNEIVINLDHKLKLLPGFFQAVCSGNKLFEIRKNDRGFKEGDIILLREWDETRGYSGREILVEITYMTDYEQKDDYVVLGIKEIMVVEYSKKLLGGIAK